MILFGQDPGLGQRVELFVGDVVGADLSPGPSLWCLADCWWLLKVVTSLPVPVQGASVRGAPTSPHDQAVGSRSLVVCSRSSVSGSLTENINSARSNGCYISPRSLIENESVFISVFIITFNMSVYVLIMCACVSRGLTDTYTSLRVVPPAIVIYRLDRKADYQHTPCCLNFGIFNSLTWECDLWRRLFKC